VTEPRTSVLFPGQGSQTPNMRQDVARSRPDLIELAAQVVGEDPFVRIEAGTRFQQPAIYCAALAGWGDLRERHSATVLAGHSLGEITALVAAGSLSEQDGLHLVCARGRLMAHAAERASGGMMAVRGSCADVEALIETTGAVVANHNAPRQVVIAGSDSALQGAERALAGAGLRAKRLSVSGAFHSPLMQPAVAPFAAEVRAVRFTEPRIPVVSCITAEPIEDPAEVLIAALTRPVRWVETVQRLHADRVEDFAETGPGTVLSGLVRRTLGEFVRG
jgi:[acyl-carrier-protein] S-malonyltransferase